MRFRTSQLSALAAFTAVLALSGCGANSAPKTASPASRFAGSEQTSQTPPDFALPDQDGQPVRLSAERGRLVLVTFLYTHCPDVCPLIAANLNGALRELGRTRRSVRVLAVSVDPKGDTARAVRAYVRLHHLLPQFRYLTGTRSQLQPVWNAYHLAVLPDPKTLDAVVDHTAYTLLIDRNGKTRVLYDSQVKARDVVHDIRILLR